MSRAHKIMNCTRVDTISYTNTTLTFRNSSSFKFSFKLSLVLCSCLVKFRKTTNFKIDRGREDRIARTRWSSRLSRNPGIYMQTRLVFDLFMSGSRAAFVNGILLSKERKWAIQLSNLLFLAENNNSMVCRTSTHELSKLLVLHMHCIVKRI